MEEWSSLCKLKVGDAVDVREQCVITMDDGAYKISDDQYFLADAFSDEGEEKLRLLSLYWACSEPAFRDAPINLLRSGGESQFARHPALFAENGLMQRALRAFPPGFPC